MGTTAVIPATTEYRVVLVQPESRGLLALGCANSWRLPRVRIPSISRPAQQLQKALKAIWGVDVFVVDVCDTSKATDGTSSFAIAELLSPPSRSDYEETTLDQIANSELSHDERQACARLLESECPSPVARIGWIDEAAAWVGSTTGRRFSTKNDIEQLNAGGGFALLRFRSDDGQSYWLKATGAPNTHELAITCCLSGLCPEFLPRLITVREEWNAWLTADAGEPLAALAAGDALVRALTAFASLQIRTIDAVDVLLTAGAIDQRVPVLNRKIDEVIAFLTDAMARQTTAKVAPLGRGRLKDLEMILRDALGELEVLDIPDALIHNDLNLGNILDNGTNCVFTDWSEAAVGNPFLSLDRFCLLNKDAAPELHSICGECWRDHLTEETVHRAQRLAPLLSIFAYLYGRGDWLNDTSKVTPQFESYARSLARHMDRAAQSPELREALCR